MKNTIDIKKKRLMSIIVMVIIIVLTLLLMLTTFMIENMYFDRYEGEHNQDNSHNNYFISMLMPSYLNLYLDAEQLSNVNFDNVEYVDMSSKTLNGTVYLNSYTKATSCTYSIKFLNDYNNFENEYYINNTDKEILNNQLILQLSGYDMATNKNITKEFDLISLKGEETILVDNLIISDIADNKNTSVEWQFNLYFRNYRNYNQINNAGKNAKGKILFEINECK